jgi:uncharacterized protein YgiM (DUF1202 family)
MTKLKAVFITVLFFALTGLTVYAIEQKMMSIQVKDGVVRSSPSFLGKIVTQLPYGERVSVQATKGAWYLIKKPEKSTDGWMHSSALSMKKIVLKPGASDVQQAASSDEITLAGKGFNQRVENDFISRNPQIDFTWINKMEKTVIPQNQILAFIKEGQLTPKGEE